jgi:hypothetical protein
VRLVATKHMCIRREGCEHICLVVTSENGASNEPQVFSASKPCSRVHIASVQSCAALCAVHTLYEAT